MSEDACEVSQWWRMRFRSGSTQGSQASSTSCVRVCVCRPYVRSSVSLCLRDCACACERVFVWCFDVCAYTCVLSYIYSPGILMLTGGHNKQ